jgi:hypothetical protein
MVTPKGSMSTEGETFHVSVLPYRCSICEAADDNPLNKFLRHALQHVSQEIDWNSFDICRVKKVAHIEHLKGRTETWSVSPSVDMLPFGVTIPATVPLGSEIPEGLMNNPE